MFGWVCLLVVCVRSKLASTALTGGRVEISVEADENAQAAFSFGFPTRTHDGDSIKTPTWMHAKRLAVQVKEGLFPDLTITSADCRLWTCCVDLNKHY